MAPRAFATADEVASQAAAKRQAKRLNIGLHVLGLAGGELA